MDYIRIMVCDAGHDFPDAKTKVKVTFPDGGCKYYTFASQTPPETARSIVLDAITEEIKNNRRGY